MALFRGVRKIQVIMSLVLIMWAQVWGGTSAERDGYKKKGENAVVERVTFQSKASKENDGVIKRAGIFMHTPHAKATILICHGFMCNKYDVGFIRLLFPKDHYNFMTFDFRAHGEYIDRQYCTFGRDEALDVIAAAEYLKSRPECVGKPLFVYGFSMGAVAAIEAQAQQRLFDAMILDCPFDATENIIKKGLENLKLSLFGYEFDIPGKNVLQKYAFHPYVQSFVKVLLKTVSNMSTYHIKTFIYPVTPAESIKLVDVPCFFIHCKNDEKIPVQAIKTIYDNASLYKVIWLTNGDRHYGSIFFNPEEYARKVQKFITRVTDGKPHRWPKVYEDSDSLMQGAV